MVNFNPSIGGEIQKVRPTIIVSNNVANQILNRAQVVPVTSSVDRLYPGEAYVIINGNRHKAMANQLTTVSKQRFGDQIGTISREDMQQVEQAIKTQLDLP